MAEHASNNTGRYLYAVVAGSDERNFGDCGIGGGIVYTVSQGEATAVVSDVPNEKLRPQRRNLASHQEVLKRLMEKTTPLPLTFGVIAGGTNAVKKILSENQGAFIEQLHRVAGKMEMGLHVTWDAPNIFDYFVNTHEELRAARDRYFGGHREPTQENKIELGRMFDRILNEDREQYTQEVEAALSPHCFEIKLNTCRTEQEVMNLACLVGRDVEADFEGGILKAAGLFDNNFAFDYNGPWAPHNFVDLELDIH